MRAAASAVRPWYSSASAPLPARMAVVQKASRPGLAGARQAAPRHLGGVGDAGRLEQRVALVHVDQDAGLPVTGGFGQRAAVAEQGEALVHLPGQEMVVGEQRLHPRDQRGGAGRFGDGQAAADGRDRLLLAALAGEQVVAVVEQRLGMVGRRRRLVEQGERLGDEREAQPASARPPRNTSPMPRNRAARSRTTAATAGSGWPANRRQASSASAPAPSASPARCRASIACRYQPGSSAWPAAAAASSAPAAPSAPAAWSAPASSIARCQCAAASA